MGYPIDLYGGTPPHVAGSDTSEAAAESVREMSGAQRQRILALIEAGPKTDEQLEQVTGLRHQSVSARRRELELKGFIVDSGQRRLNQSGRSAVIWMITGPESK